MVCNFFVFLELARNFHLSILLLNYIVFVPQNVTCSHWPTPHAALSNMEMINFRLTAFLFLVITVLVVIIILLVLASEQLCCFKSFATHSNTVHMLEFRNDCWNLSDVQTLIYETIADFEMCTHQEPVKSGYVKEPVYFELDPEDTCTCQGACNCTTSHWQPGRYNLFNKLIKLYNACI